MSQETQDAVEQSPAEEAEKLVPVGESIKYRRRAQQAEQRLQQVEQQLAQLQSQLEGRGEELASAESQRDEIQSRLHAAENRRLAEKLLMDAGVADLETGYALLSGKVDLAGEVDAESLASQVEQLLIDKPFLSAAAMAPLPPRTAAPRTGREGLMAQVAKAAQRAAGTGSRRDIAEYLRLRRQAAVSQRSASK